MQPHATKFHLPGCIISKRVVRLFDGIVTFFSNAGGPPPRSVDGAAGALRPRSGVRNSAAGARNSAAGARNSAAGARNGAAGARNGAVGARNGAAGARRPAMSPARLAPETARKKLFDWPRKKSPARCGAEVQGGDLRQRSTRNLPQTALPVVAGLPHTD
jgi:hypothetical protein